MKYAFISVHLMKGTAIKTNHEDNYCVHERDNNTIFALIFNDLMYLMRNVIRTIRVLLSLLTRIPIYSSIYLFSYLIYKSFIKIATRFIQFAN